MRIRILSCSHDQTLPLNLNGLSLIVPVHGDGNEDGASEIPAAFLPALNDSHVEYEIVAPARDEAGEGAGGDSGEPSAEITPKPSAAMPPAPPPAKAKKRKPKKPPKE